MPKSFSIQWEGDKLLGITLEAVEKAIDETTHETAIVMGGDAPRDSGLLADNFLSTPAKVEGKVVTGEVGADAAVYYAAAVEANHPGKAGFIRRAADREFPNVVGRIKGNL